jgi:hypothetical protein
MKLLLTSTIVGLCACLACGGTTTTNLDAGADGSSDAPVADSGGGPCDGGACTFGLHCCSNACINEMNDPLNCGGCGIVCSGSQSMCLGGSCQSPTCQPSCSDGQVCCDIPGPGPSQPVKCVDGVTCPVGCPACK